MAANSKVVYVCKECGYEGVYEGKRCPQCRAELSLSAEETAKIELNPLTRCFALTSSMACLPLAEATSAIFCRTLKV